MSARSWPRVGDAIERDYSWIDGEEPVTKALGIFSEKHPPILLVIHRGGKLLGVLTERVLMRPRLNPRGLKAKQIALKSPRLGPERSVLDAARMMSESGMKALPVVERGRPIGIISIWGLVDTLSQRLLGRVRVRDIMSRSVVTIDAGSTIGKAIVTMREQGISRLPVMKGGRLAGIVTIHDIIEKIMRPRERISKGDMVGEKVTTLGNKIEAIMTTSVITVKPSDLLIKAVERMRLSGVSCLVVVDNGDLTGIVTTMDILEHIAAQASMLEGPINIQVSYKSILISPEIKGRVIRDAELFTKRFGATLGNGTLSLHFKEHREKHGEMHLIHCRAQLKTDRLHIVGIGEHWRHDLAARVALERIERQFITMKEVAAKYPYANEILDRIVSGL